MFGWRLSQFGLVFFVICVNKAFNATWLINDSSRLKDKEGLASWSSTGGGDLRSVSSEERNRLGDKEYRTLWDPTGFKKFGINPHWNRRPQQDDKATEGRQDVPNELEGHRGDENYGNQLYYKNAQKTVPDDDTKGKSNLPRERTLLWNRPHDVDKHTLVRKRAHESHSGILMEQDGISSGEADAHKTVLREKRNDIPISSTHTDSDENNAELSDYTQTQTTVKSTVSKRANRNSDGQGGGEKSTVTAKPASFVTLALESFPSQERMTRRESLKSWEIIGVSGVFITITVDHSLYYLQNPCSRFFETVEFFTINTKLQIMAT